jgi:hypothetical protein
MIRFTIQNNNLVPSLPADATSQELQIAQTIATNFNAVGTGNSNYKTLLESLDRNFQSSNTPYQQYIDDSTISQLENFYTGAVNITPWDSTKQGADLANFDAKFYAGLVPNKVEEWNKASSDVSFGGKKVANVDITQKYPTLDSYLHSDYTFVGAPGGLPGKQKQLDTYTEELRPSTYQEQQILREALLGTSEEQPSSLAELAAQNYVDVQGEKVFGALSADVLKQTLDEYNKNLKKQEIKSMYTSMGLPNSGSLKEDIKNSILGDIGAGGFLSFGKGQELEKGLSASLEKGLGLGASVEYNWQDWFDKTLAERYKQMQEIRDPSDTTKTYKIDQQFATDFIEKYLRPRFNTSKSMSEFISYMDVKEDEQNVLQTQLASNALKQLAIHQATNFIDDLTTKTTTKSFNPDFYWNPEVLEGVTHLAKEAFYKEQRESVQANWDTRNSDAIVKDGKTWKQLAYEYGVNLEDKSDFARLHYQILGKDKNYDPVADSYTRADLAEFIRGDLTKALEAEKSSLSNPVFKDFVSAESKATDLVAKLNLEALPEELKQRLKEIGVNEVTDPAETVKESLTKILSTDPALEIRERIRQLNEQGIKPTQEKLGIEYIQRDSDEKEVSSTGQSKLFSIFQKAGYKGTETDFYTDFFPDATEEDKDLLPASGKAFSSTDMTAKNLLGFSMPDFSNPFAAMGSISSMIEDEDEDSNIKQAETYTPKRSTYFQYFEDEEDEGAPSYFDL